MSSDSQTPAIPEEATDAARNARCAGGEYPDDSWVLTTHVEKLVEDFSRYAESGSLHLEEARALGNILAHLHGLTGGRRGMSTAEVETAMKGSVR